MPNLGYEKFNSRWIDHPDVREVVRDLLIGDVLTFPKGASGVGHVSADINAGHNPNVVADLENPPFQENSFDTVYCDPPYQMLGDKTNSTKWIQDLYSIARKRLIVQGPNKALYPGTPADEQLICLKPKPGSTKNWVRIIHVFDHPSTTLDSF